ncbi:hypothetical protein YC2023_124296 [Brassica napus]
MILGVLRSYNIKEDRDIWSGAEKINVEGYKYTCLHARTCSLIRGSLLKIHVPSYSFYHVGIFTS